MMEDDEQVGINSMIRIINSKDLALDFALSFAGDREFSDPMLSNAGQVEGNLLKSIEEPKSYRTFGVYQDDALAGLFVFMVNPEEKYAEMIVGLSRTEAAYTEMMDYLKFNFSGYHCDFVYNPRNYLLHGLLKNQGASFYTEQTKMVLQKIVPTQIPGNIVPYDPTYWESYQAIHDDSERYWTAEKIVACPDRFRVFLALDGNDVVGYMDVTHCFDENEPYDLFVREDMRQKGYGRGLLAKAIEDNKPNGMMLLVDYDDTVIINLCQSMGFVKDELGGNITAYMTL